MNIPIQPWQIDAIARQLSKLTKIAKRRKQTRPASASPAMIRREREEMSRRRKEVIRAAALAFLGTISGTTRITAADVESRIGSLLSERRHRRKPFALSPERLNAVMSKPSSARSAGSTPTPARATYVQQLLQLVF